MTTELQTHYKTAGMDLQKQTQVRRNPTMMTLEEYIDFFDSNKQSFLTSGRLNQIIMMHAFKVIQSVPKDQRVEAVKVIDLMEPTRSTLNNDAVSPCTSLTLQEAIKDISSIKWQECCITSLETLNTVNFDQLDLTPATTTTTITSISSSKLKSKHDLSISSKKILPAAMEKRSVKEQVEPQEMEPWLGDVDREIIPELPACSGKVWISLVYRKGNMVVDLLAKAAAATNDLDIAFVSSPHF